MDKKKQSNLLIITQKVDKNDSFLGFFHKWIEKFAEYYAKVIVICLEEGKHNLQGNVRVLSLGKETLIKKNVRSRFVRRTAYILRFFKHIISQRRNYDAVFIHMNPEYVLLGASLWKFLRKKIGLWYAHGYTNALLQIAENLADVIFTSTKSGCRIDSGKIVVTGQGVDTDVFCPPTVTSNEKDFISIVSIGRISPVKDYETLISAVEILTNSNVKVKVCIIGEVVLSEHKIYFQNLKDSVRSKGLEGVISFYGGVTNEDVVKYLAGADLFVSTSHTGSLDKAMLEAMSCEVFVLTCNEAMLEVLGKYKEFCMFEKKNSIELAEKIMLWMNVRKEEQGKICEGLRDIVVRNHRLINLIPKIIANYGR